MIHKRPPYGNPMTMKERKKMSEWKGSKGQLQHGLTVVAHGGGVVQGGVDGRRQALADGAVVEVNRRDLSMFLFQQLSAE